MVNSARLNGASIFVSYFAMVPFAFVSLVVPSNHKSRHFARSYLGRPGVRPMFVNVSLQNRISKRDGRVSGSSPLWMTDNTVENKDNNGYRNESSSDSNDIARGSLESGLIPFRSLRTLLSILSLVGCAESIYLTFNKVFSSPGTICPTQGCLDVLAGPFSTFLGVPLSAFGALAYAAFGYLCFWPSATVEEERTKVLEANPNASSEQVEAAVTEAYDRRDAATRPILFALSTIQFVFSAYLTTIMKFVIRSMCPFCLVSAAISTAIFILTVFVGRAVPRLKSALTIGMSSAFVAAGASGLSLVMAWPGHLRAQPPTELQSPPAITTKSSDDSLRIARKLRAKGAKMYGAYWCAHCYDQKQRFGKKAFGMLDYIECDKYGVNTQNGLCIKKRIPGYPTWEIDGELFPGEIDIQDLERLAEESNTTNSN